MSSVFSAPSPRFDRPKSSRIKSCGVVAEGGAGVAVSELQRYAGKGDEGGVGERVGRDGDILTEEGRENRDDRAFQDIESGFPLGSVRWNL